MEEKLWDLFFNNLHAIFFPEEWIAADMAMSKMELLCLLLLSRQDEQMMSQLADHLHIPMSTATGIVNRLVKQDYVLRLQNQENRRVVTVQLTPEGKKAVEQFKKIITEFSGRIESSLTAEEQQVLFSVFAKILGLLEKPEKAEAAATKPIKRITIQ